MPAHVCEVCGAECATSQGLASHRRSHGAHAQPGSLIEAEAQILEPPSAGGAAPDPDATHRAAEQPAPARPAELDPEAAPRRSRWRGRFGGRGRGGEAATPASTKEKAPKGPKGRGKGSRVALDTTFSDTWAFMGRRLEGTPHYPTGRMLQYQAPAAGIILDKALAGTIPDRLFLQPMARGRDKWEDAAYLLAGPLFTFSITQSHQQLQEAINRGDLEAQAVISKRIELQWEGFAWLIEMMLPRLAAGKERADEKKAKRDEAVQRAFPELQRDGVSPADLLRSMLFTPPDAPNTEGSHGGAGNGTEGPSGQGPMAQRGESRVGS